MQCMTDDPKSLLDLPRAHFESKYKLNNFPLQTWGEFQPTMAFTFHLEVFVNILP